MDRTFCAENVYKQTGADAAIGVHVIFSRTLSAAGVVALTLSVLSGCSSGPSDEERRRASLNEAVDAFDAASLTTVLCDADGGEISLNRGLTRSLVLEGADNWGAVEKRFDDLGYSVSSSDHIMAANISGLYASLILIKQPGSEPELEEAVEADGCEIPESGAISLKFEERDIQ